MSRQAIGIVVCVCFCLCSPQSFAEDRVNEAVRLSKLTLSAMECANFAPNDAEAGRLGEIGIGAGKNFLELMPTLSDDNKNSQDLKLRYCGEWFRDIQLILCLDGCGKRRKTFLMTHWATIKKNGHIISQWNTQKRIVRSFVDGFTNQNFKRGRTTEACGAESKEATLAHLGTLFDFVSDGLQFVSLQHIVYVIHRNHDNHPYRQANFFAAF
jgi:hypothetical protein